MRYTGPVSTASESIGRPEALSPRALALRYFPLFAAACVLVWHSLQFNFVTDDAYISFVYSRNFAEHGSLVFNLGDAVEGYTNFLWTFGLGVLMVAGIPPEVSSLVLGTGFALGTLWVAFRLVEHITESKGGIAAIAPWLLALASGFACWSSGGLETQLFTFLVVSALSQYIRADLDPRRFRKSGILLALAAMTRPEGLLITAILGAHRIAVNLIKSRRVLPSRYECEWALAFLLVWAPWFAWRFWFYGHPFPNTFYVKAAGPASPGYEKAMLDNGLHYVGQWASQVRIWFALPLLLAGLLVARPPSRRFFAGSLLALVGIVYLAYTAKVGGDFMGLHRFIMPVFVVVAIGVTLGLHAVATAFPNRVLGQRLAIALGVLIVAGFGYSQLRLTRESLRWGNFASDRGIDTPAYLDAYTEDRATIGKHMAPCFLPDDFSIVGGAGAQPYFGRMRGIDVFGLVSDKIAHLVPRTRPRAGHNKWGPDELLATYDPDFVFSCYSIHADPKRPQLNCNPAFWLRRGFEQVTLHIPGLRERGEYYTFLAKTERQFQCAGRVE